MIKEIIKGLAIFSLGASVGYVAAHIIEKTKYEKRLEKNINDIMQYSRNGEKNDSAETEDISEQHSEPEEDISKPKEPKSTLNYKPSEDSKIVNYSDFYKNNIDDIPKEENLEEKAVIMIGADDFDEDDEFTKITLNYYEDGYLANLKDEIVSEDELTTGGDIREFIKFNTSDFLYLRKPLLAVDYEIIREHGTYYDVTGNTPPDKEEE